MPALTQYIPAILLMLAIGLINYPISLKLGRKNLILVIVVPLVFLIPGGILFLLGSILNLGWGSLGYFIIGGILILGGIGSLVSSFVVYFKIKKDK
jgi:hypothetical protein